MTDRAQSESLGFAVVFGIVMLMILIVSAAAYPGLRNVEHNQRVQNMEEGFTAFADNVDAVVSNEAPSRETRLRLAGGQLNLGDPVNITVSGEAFSPITYTVRPVVYQSNDGATVVYLNGAVIRGDDDGSVMLREPGMVLSEDHTVVTVIDIQSDDAGTGGEGTVELETSRTRSQLDVVNTTSQNVTITIDSPRADAWRRGLAQAYDDVNCSRTENTAVCWIDPNHQLHVTRVNISLTIR